jgi:hypothetical protein
MHTSTKRLARSKAIFSKVICSIIADFIGYLHYPALDKGMWTFL